MNRDAMPRRPFAAALLLLLAACTSSEPSAVGPSADGVDLRGAAIGGPFTLTGETGKLVRWDDFKGKYRTVGSSRVDLQACKLEYSIVSPK